MEGNPVGHNYVIFFFLYLNIQQNPNRITEFLKKYINQLNYKCKLLYIFLGIKLYLSIWSKL